MKKLSNIYESIWTNINKRSEGNLERKEDIVGNIKELKPVDMGCDVLWADRDLEYDGNVHFLFDDIQRLIQNSEWRLPTRKDIDDLHRYCVLKHNIDDLYFVSPNSQKLIFNRNGMVYNTSVSHGNEIKTYLSEYWGWTSEEWSSKEIHCYIITDNDILYTPKKFGPGNAIATDRTAKLCVRLIKDK